MATSHEASDDVYAPKAGSSSHGLLRKALPVTAYASPAMLEVIKHVP